MMEEQKGTLPDKPKAAPVSQAKAEPKPVEWKLAKGKVVNIPGLFEVSDKNVNHPAVLKCLIQHEARTGHRLFGVVFVKK